MIDFTIADDVGRRCLSDPARTAIEIVGSQTRLSYADLWRRAGSMAGALAPAPSGKWGALVATLLPNGADAALAFVACQLAERVIVPLNWRLSDAELEYQLRDCDARVLLSSGALLERARALAARLGSVHVIDAATIVDAAHGYRPGALGRDRGNEPCVVGYTSGTTGFPKGAVYSHDHYALNNYRWGWEFGLTGDHVVLITGPLFHISYAGFALAALTIGARVRIMPEFEAAIAYDEFAQRSSFAFLVPSMTAMLVDEWRGRGCAPMPAARFILSAGAPLPRQLLEDALQMFPNGRIAEIFGWTEGAYTSFEVKRADAIVPHCVGWPALGAEVRIFDEQGLPCPAGQPGEVGVRAATRFLGYLGRPEESAAAIRDGFTLSGDIGVLLDDGRLCIIDRKKDMIISGGENVYTAEVERVLLEDQRIAEAAVVGAPDPKWGEVVTAVVVARPGASLTLESVREHCRRQLAGYKLPQRLEVVEALPRNSMGKVLKRALAQGLAARGAAPGR